MCGYSIIDSAQFFRPHDVYQGTKCSLLNQIHTGNFAVFSLQDQC